MRRLEQRRLEAVLTCFGELGLAPDPGVNFDGLVKELESVATATAHQAEAARHEVSRMRGVLDALSEALVVVDESGLESFRNLAGSRMASPTTSQVLVDQAMEECLSSALDGEATEKTVDLYTPLRRKVSVRALPLHSDGRRLGAVAIVEDVSEKHRLDTVRRDFVANVSHELKTPVGALSLLAETLDGEDDPDVVARLAARVASEAERLGRIIDDLLDLSRIEATTSDLDHVLAVADILREATDPLKRVAQQGGVNLDVQFPPSDLWLVGDPRDLVSALANLVDNAIKYSGSGSQVKVWSESSQESVRIYVEDRGIGIPSQHRDRIFERFYRVDRARSRATGGTGLGLSIVRHIMANHGGSVEVSSVEGEGSTFVLVLNKER